jgi:His-Xaa-Ser system radical SAM maturase HxsB
MRSPAKNLKIEFQGGESLLNFELVQHIVIESKRMNDRANDPKNLGFVIATNLAVITDDILSFCKQHDIVISTSLDGPKELHNKNRPRSGHDSYERAVAGIDRARNYLGRDKVSALMTTTEAGLNQVEAIIDEYVDRNFTGIFLRPLSPYGFAIKTKFYRAYNTRRWLDFYIKGLEYIIELNRQGVEFREHYASTILTKMLTSSDPGYVDLMSPAGIATGAIVYNYNGAVYASDESRMLAEMGDQKFKLGNVIENTYEEIFLNETLLEALEDSFAQSVPMCTDCAFEPFCGSDPVFHWGQHSDLVGKKPESEFCQRNMSIFKYLIDKMESDRFARSLFLKWAN